MIIYIIGGIAGLALSSAGTFYIFRAQLEALESRLKDHAEAIGAHLRILAAGDLTELKNHVTLGVRTTVNHTKDVQSLTLQHVLTGIDGVRDTVKDHITAEVSKVVGGVKGARHEVCSICAKLSHTWQVVEGKIVCLDCTIRKAL